MTVEPGLNRLLAQSVFMTNCELNAGYQLPPSAHSFLSKKSGVKGPANRDALNLYHHLDALANRNAALPCFLQDHFAKLEEYLNTIGLLYVESNQKAP